MNRFAATATATYTITMEVWVNGKKKFEEFTKDFDYPIPWTVPNEDFEKGTPERMKFLYGMMKAPCSIYELTDEKLATAKEFLTSLQDFDPHYIYELSEQKKALTKMERTPKPLTGELAELEDEFLKNRTIAKENRQFVVQIFDDIKRGYPHDKNTIKVLRQIINPQLNMFTND